MVFAQANFKHLSNTHTQAPSNEKGAQGRDPLDQQVQTAGRRELKTSLGGRFAWTDQQHFSLQRAFWTMLKLMGTRVVQSGSLHYRPHETPIIWRLVSEGINPIFYVLKNATCANTKRRMGMQHETATRSVGKMISTQLSRKNITH